MKEGTNFIIRNSEGDFLMQFRDSNASYNPMRWDFFGGTMEDGESPVANAVRELYEEIEVASVARDWKLKKTPLESPEVFEHVLLFLQPVSWKQVGELAEGAGAAFFSRKELAHLNLHNTTRRIIELYL